MKNETIPDILREMVSITKRGEYSVETMAVVIRYGMRLANAYERHIKDEVQQLIKLNEDMYGKR